MKKLFLTFIASFLISSISFGQGGTTNLGGNNPPLSRPIVPIKINAISNYPQDKCDDSDPSISCASKNEFVVKYKALFSEIKKDSIRKEYSVIEYYQCPCGDTQIEYWKIQKSKIEEVVDNHKDKNDDSEVEIDNQFYFSINKKYSTALSVGEFKPDYLVPNTSKTVNIAIIDTGIEYNKITSPLLYDSSNNQCFKQNSGWNFIHNNSNVSDDNGHGTLVAKTIISALNRSNLHSQIPNENNQKISILPVKVFDKEGNGNYFNIVCALSYIKTFKDIHLINMSFGFQKPENIGYRIRTMDKPEIMEELIESINKRMLLITSAGNRETNRDTDGIGNEHFPSGLTSKNIIGVAGYEKNKQNDILIASKSNYGTKSIDIAAPFTFLHNSSPTTRGKYSGTSFSAAYITGKVVNFMVRDNPHNFIYKSDYNPLTDGKKLIKEAPMSKNLRGYIKKCKYL